jgi:sulfur carrier protein
MASQDAGRRLLLIEVNGQERETAATTVLALVQELSLDPRKVAVERNLEIVPRSLHAETALAPGDRIELVQFVGGG